MGRKRRSGAPLRAAALAALLAAAGVTLGGCSDGDPPFRIGVITDCVGINRALRDAELAGAELPLLQRGSSLRGGLAGRGVTEAEVAGRSVELVPGCTELWEFSTLIAEVRRLVERERVDAVVAAGGGADEVVLREVAGRYPGVVFVPAAHGPREVTSSRPAPNLFRFSADHGQGVAGLGTYAYRRLGWRRAAIVASDWDEGWGARDAFAAEFCSLGGEITAQIPVAFFDTAGGDVASVPGNVDGVAVFSPVFFGPAGFLNRLARGYRDPARRILVGPSTTGDPAVFAQTRRALRGVVGSSTTDPTRLRRYLGAFRAAFPGISGSLAVNPLVTGYRDAVEALVTGLARADGNDGRLPEALARVRVDLLSGLVRLDRNRQAVADTSLVRIGPPGAPPPGVKRIGTIRAVDQSVGGLLPSSLVTGHDPHPCVRAAAPPGWAR